jgi:hypothetical protein
VGFGGATRGGCCGSVALPGGTTAGLAKGVSGLRAEKSRRAGAHAGYQRQPAALEDVAQEPVGLCSDGR